MAASEQELQQIMEGEETRLQTEGFSVFNQSMPATSIPIRTKINVRSFDFDGCLINRDFMRRPESTERIIEANQAFIAAITTEIQQLHFEEIIFMVGSNRQSLPIDDVNRRKNKVSCYPALHQLCQEFQERIAPIPCRVDPYLLADTYGKKTIGENYKKAMEGDPYYNYSHWLFDDSKVTILYAQIHKLASDYPDAEIVYDFYDDRYMRDDILNGLAEFFNANTDLIPSNLKIRLHHYEGGEITMVSEIKGSGVIDIFYQEHIHLMVQCTELSLRDNLYSKNHVLSKLTFEGNLDNFKTKRQIKLNNPLDGTTYSKDDTSPVYKLGMIMIGDTPRVFSSRTYGGLFAQSDAQCSSSRASFSKLDSEMDAENLTKYGFISLPRCIRLRFISWLGGMGQGVNAREHLTPRGLCLA